MPFKIGAWSLKKVYHAYMYPIELFFSYLNIFLPINQALHASTDAVKDVTTSSLFMFTSLTMKLLVLIFVLLFSVFVGTMSYTFIYFVSMPIDT